MSLLLMEAGIRGGMGEGKLEEKINLCDMLEIEAQRGGAQQV